MKQLIPNYTFDKTAKTVTFTDFASIRLDRVLMITNVTSNVIIYLFNDPTLGGTVGGNVLTLTFDTTAMANTDKLQIFYDCAVGDPATDPVSTNLGATTDAAVTTDANATVSGKLRGLVKMIADTWDSSLHAIKSTLGTGIDEDNDSITTYEKGWNKTRVAASGLVSASPILLGGYYVEASSTCVFSIYDIAVAGTGDAMLAKSKTVAANDLVEARRPIYMANGAYVAIESGSGVLYILTRKVTSV